MGLVLTRQRGQTIRIADNIYITVESIRGGKIRLNISAPVEIPVLRLELDEAYDALTNEENRNTNPQAVYEDTTNPKGPLHKFLRVQDKPDCGTT